MAVNIENYNKIKEQLSQKNVTLVAVSKIKTIAEIQILYDLGQRDFGENYVQELLEKYEALPKDIRWHFIGHLQSNKVKYIAAFVHLIHGVDSLSLIKEINKQGKKLNRQIPCLLQVHIAKEETKFGFSHEETRNLISEFSETTQSVYPCIELQGLMGMASFTEDNSLIIDEFTGLKKLFDEIRLKWQSPLFNILSMGMSADYMFGINAGSTMVRIGSLLFGSRIKQ